MPRFNDAEKEIIRQKLLSEGERLFSAFGLKKVSVDELARAAGIAKGSFYAFFQNKESLFMEIVSGIQQKIWTETDALLQAHSGLPPRELVKKLFLWTLERTMRYPLIRMMDSETTEYLYRKLPGEVLESHAREDGAELEKLREYGIRFKQDIPTATKILQTLAIGFVSLSGEEEPVRFAVMETMLDGVINEIVEGER